MTEIAVGGYILYSVEVTFSGKTESAGALGAAPEGRRTGRCKEPVRQKILSRIAAADLKTVVADAGDPAGKSCACLSAGLIYETKGGNAGGGRVIIAEHITSIGQKLFLTSVIDKTVIEKILSCHISVISAGVILILDFVPGIGNPHGGYTGERRNIFFKVSSHGMTDRQVVPYCGRNCVRIDRIAVFESIYRLER